MRALVAVCTHEKGPLLNLHAARQALREGDEAALFDASATQARRDVVRTLAARHGLRYVATPGAGLSRQRNVAAGETGERALVFLDDDCVPRPGWLDALVAPLDDGADLATARVVTPSPLLTKWSRFFDQDHGRRSRTFTARDLRVLPDAPLAPFAGESGVAPWAVGAGSSFAVHPDLVDELGGFREDLGVGSPGRSGEDVDFFFRVLRAGGCIHYAADAVVEHWHVRRSADDYLRTAHAYGWGGRAFVRRAIPAKPSYVAVLLGRPVQLLLIAGRLAAQRDRATAAMCLSAMRGWLGLPFRAAPTPRALR